MTWRLPAIKEAAKLKMFLVTRIKNVSGPKGLTIV